MPKKVPVYEILARSDAAFDGRDFNRLGKADKERYLLRSKAAISALHKKYFIIIPFEADDDMCKAGVKATELCVAGKGAPFSWPDIEHLYDIFAAMLDANAEIADQIKNLRIS